MGRTKDLRDNIPFSPGSFGSMEEFAASIGWDLSKPRGITHCGMLEGDYQALVKHLAAHISKLLIETDGEDLTVEHLEDSIDEVLDQYVFIDYT